MSISRDDVVDAYRSILSRDPESESVIAHYMKTPDVETLNLILTNSPEYISKPRIIGSKIYHRVSVMDVLMDFVGCKDDLYAQNIPLHVAQLGGFAKLAKSICPKDGICLDIGANIGLTTSILSQIAPDGQVISFEPSPKNFEYLQENVKQNNLQNCQLNNMGIGDSNTSLSFHENTQGSACHIVTKNHMCNQSTPSITIPIVSLDRFLQNKKVDFIKIDVEGFEQDVLLGMDDTIKQFNPTIYMEFNSYCLIAFKNSCPRQLVDIIRDKFSYCFCMKDNLYSRILTDIEWMEFLHNNLVLHGCVDDLILTNDEDIAKAVIEIH